MIFAGASLSWGCDRDAEVDRYRASEIFNKAIILLHGFPIVLLCTYIESSCLFVARYR